MADIDRTPLALSRLVQQLGSELPEQRENAVTEAALVMELQTQADVLPANERVYAETIRADLLDRPLTDDEMTDLCSTALHLLRISQKGTESESKVNYAYVLRKAPTRIAFPYVLEALVSLDLDVGRTDSLLVAFQDGLRELYSDTGYEPEIRMLQVNEGVLREAFGAISEEHSEDEALSAEISRAAEALEAALSSTK